MGGFDRVIINEIIENDINIFRLDCDFSGRPEIIYGIDSSDATDIQLYTEKGPVKYNQELIGSRTVLKFKNPKKYYVLVYSWTFDKICIKSGTAYNCSL